MPKAFVHLISVTKQLAAGRFSHAFYEIAQSTPRWLFNYNQSSAFRATLKDITLLEHNSLTNKVQRAESSQTDAIVRISGIEKSEVEYLMGRKVTCFIGALPSSDWSSVVWVAYENCFIRGMSYKFEIGSNTMYTFGWRTEENARHRGLNHQLLNLCLEEARLKGITTLYSMVQFTNEYAMLIHKKLGYNEFRKITFVRLLGVRICLVRILDTGRTELRVLFRLPRDGVTII